MKELIISKSKKIIIQVSKWKDHISLDIRLYVNTDSYTGYTKKGISIPLSKAIELADIITTEENLIRKESIKLLNEVLKKK